MNKSDEKQPEPVKEEEQQEQQEMIILKCPHCNCLFEVLPKEINCKIFRHAVHKKTGKPINPHASKEECEKLVDKKLVRGCAGPFELKQNENGWIAVKCEYK